MTTARFGAGRPASAGTSWRVVRKGTTLSTNVDALDLARAGDPGRVWVVAETQEGGRGRRGRIWTSEPGNLYASALIVDPCEPRRLPDLPFVTAVAVADAIDRVAAGRRTVGIKWPNDLLMEGRKLVGILLEASQVGAGRGAVAIGIGVNCRHHPSGTETPATDLFAEGFDVAPEVLFEELREAFAVRFTEWDGGRDFASVRAAWLARAVGIGGPIRVRLVEGEDEGVFEGIDEDGHLLLARADGSRRMISAGDVFFPRKKDEKW